VRQALTGLSLSASSVGSRPAVHAPITHENEQGPGGHTARLRVTRTRTSAGRLHRRGSEVEESMRRLDGMSLWAVLGCRRRRVEALSTGGRSGGGVGRGANIYLISGTRQRTRTERTLRTTSFDTSCFAHKMAFGKPVFCSFV